MVTRESGMSEEQKMYETKTGFIIYRLDKEHCEIDYIRIDKSMHRCGEGSALLQEFVKKQTKENNITDYNLDAVSQSEIMNLDKLVTFYKKNGFEVLERFEMDDVERAIMWKEVKNDKTKSPQTNKPNTP